jgi:hypothetical protein
VKRMKYKDVKDRLDKTVRDLLEKGATGEQIDRWADDAQYTDFSGGT